MKSGFIALALFVLAAAPVGAQQVYSWTDANGVKHFSDTPPEKGVDAKRLIVRSGVTSEEAPAEEEPKDGPKMAAAAGYSPEDITRNCAAARKNLATFTAAEPGADADPEAQIAYQENVNKAREQIRLFCGE